MQVMGIGSSSSFCMLNVVIMDTCDLSVTVLGMINSHLCLTVFRLLPCIGVNHNEEQYLP
jgi:hypothetical protein